MTAILRIALYALLAAFMGVAVLLMLVVSVGMAGARW